MYVEGNLLSTREQWCLELNKQKLNNIFISLGSFNSRPHNKISVTTGDIVWFPQSLCCPLSLRCQNNKACYAQVQQNGAKKEPVNKQVKKCRIPYGMFAFGPQ